jgi:glycosyltransferase involved in cell wall biosynthesis
VTDPTIDPALGLDLEATRTLGGNLDATVTVLIPAHNESATIRDVVNDARRSLALLDVDGETIVSASACTDDTAEIAAEAGAVVIEAAAGKGAALREGLARATGDIVCIVDGDVQYLGDPPLVALLTQPIRQGLADACISDLYWRPIYPQLWLYGFFAPVAGRLFPELLPKCGSTPWSGQRAALRHLWPTELPDGFTVDLALLLHWNEHALRLRPVLADDWVNPQRPKPELMREELELLLNEATSTGRLNASAADRVRGWYSTVHRLMAEYEPDVHDPAKFERQILRESLHELDEALSQPPAG